MVISLRRLRRRWARIAAIAIVLWYLPWIAAQTGAGAVSHPRVINHLAAAGRVVALTLADGPADPVVPAVLGALKRSHVSATFFVVGLTAAGQSAVLRRARRLGDGIENHSQAHINLAAHSFGQDLADLRAADRAIARAAGTRPHWLLPPYGAVNRAVLRAARQAGLAVVLPSPWENAAYVPDDPAELVHRVLSHAAPGDIIVIHPGLDPDGLGRAVTEIVALLHAEGYWAGSLEAAGRVCSADPLSDFGKIGRIPAKSR